MGGRDEHGLPTPSTALARGGWMPRSGQRRAPEPENRQGAVVPEVADAEDGAAGAERQRPTGCLPGHPPRHESPPRPPLPPPLGLRGDPPEVAFGDGVAALEDPGQPEDRLLDVGREVEWATAPPAA